MMNDKQINSRRHSVFNLHVHLVFVAKYRRNIFTNTVLKDLENIFNFVCSNLEANLIEFNGEENHVHLLIQYPPKLAIFNFSEQSKRSVKSPN